MSAQVTHPDTGPTIIGALSEIAADYDALFCDLWGCVHDGERLFWAAVDALLEFRSRGGVVVLVTNAPRPRRSVLERLNRLGMPPAAFDAIVSSGDAAQAAFGKGQYGRYLHHLGPTRDDGLLRDDTGRPLDIERVSIDRADAVVCTGLHDDTHTPRDYGDILGRAAQRRLPMICANPDAVVDVGSTRIYCAGSLADAYVALGGRVVHVGKPHPPIYALARASASAAWRGHGVPERILCIGDNLATDIRGAKVQGFDSLFVTGGIACRQTRTAGDSPDPVALASTLAEAAIDPTVSIGTLR